MNEFISELKNRFGDKSVEIIQPKNTSDYTLALISVDKRSTIKILITLGLSEYDQPVPEKYHALKNIELYFCLPSYWDIDNSNQTWIFDWIQKLAKHIVSKNTWFGHGHTIPNGNPATSISQTMKQNYFMLSGPIFLKNELKPISIEKKEIQFLSIIPIFEDELDYKLGKGTYKLIKKMNDKGISELLDDYRMTCLKSKWRIFN
jgi:hypothetical protein